MMHSIMPYEKKYARVLGRRMAYVETGQGDPIVFLHGNPTSSFLWRNILPYLEGLGRCIAPDLIGMGDSEKLLVSGPHAYTFVEHRRYLDVLLQTLNVERAVTLVLHDWGSALGFDWANQHRDAMKGIAYMEALVQPLSQEWTPPIFQGFRSAAGEQMILEDNLFLEIVLPRNIIRALSSAEMEEYRRPYLHPGEDRRPLLTWPRQLPIGGEPADVVNVVRTYGTWLATSPVPKLFVNAEPGAILTGVQRTFCRTWTHQNEVTVSGKHFLQEDAPDQIGEAVANWYRHLDQQGKDYD